MQEQIEQLTGKSAPDDLIDELYDVATTFDKRMIVDVVRAYHFGPKFLVELEEWSCSMGLREGRMWRDVSCTLMMK